MRMDGIIAKGQLVPLMFTQDQVAASQAGVAMNIIEAYGGTTLSVLDANEYVIPWPFDVVGISVRASEARTAGTLTADATIDGTAQTVQAKLDATNTQSHSRVVPRETKRGRAGQRVGCKLTTDGAWAPVTADIVVIVWVLAYLEGV